MITALRNYRSQGGVIDTKMREDILVLFIEYSQGVNKVKCYDRLLNVLTCNS